MANRLPEAKRAELWLAYQEQQSIHQVARKCAVHHKTVERYRVLENWDERLSEIREKARRRADYSLAEAMAESLALVRDYKSRLGLALSTKHVSGEEVTATELERIVKLESFLLGGVEGRQQVVTEFVHWSDDELEAFAVAGTQPSRARSSKA